MCDAPATTSDHIPPKCIFPEQKDVGVNYRKNLIEVPACKIHNRGTSLDDEYIMGVLAFHWRNNQAAHKQSVSKIKRAFERNKRYYDLFFGKGKHHFLYLNGERLITASVDINRVNSIMQKIARGIYYNYFKRKWLKNVNIQHISLVSIYNQNPGSATVALMQLTQAISLLCSKNSPHGENPDIFYYQVVYDNPSAGAIMRLVFYDSFEVIAILDDIE